MIALAGGGAAAAVVIVVVLVLALGGSSSPATYRIVAPATAGGWHRNGSVGKPQLSRAQLRASQMQKFLGGRAKAGVSAIYTDPAGGQEVIFTGATGRFGDPGRLIANLRAHPDTSISQFATVTWSHVDPGPHGGDAACGEYVSKLALLPAHIVVCAWQTTGSFGELVELPPARSALVAGAQRLSPGTLAAQMRRMRPDLETVQ